MRPCLLLSCVPAKAMPATVEMLAAGLTADAPLLHPCFSPEESVLQEPACATHVSIVARIHRDIGGASKWPECRAIPAAPLLQASEECPAGACMCNPLYLTVPGIQRKA